MTKKNSKLKAEAVGAFRELISYLKDRLHLIDMSSWSVKNTCGTTACVAGFMNIYHGYKAQFLDSNGYYDDGTRPSRRATKLPAELAIWGSSTPQRATFFLGITQAQADRLYYSYNWPKKFINDYNRVFNKHYPKEYQEEVRLRGVKPDNIDWIDYGRLPTHVREELGSIVIERLEYFVEKGK